jgi:hypothetical protein
MPSEPRSDNPTNSVPSRLEAIQVDSTEFDGLTPADLPPETIRRYIAARNWRANHIADRSTYADPTWRAVLRHLGDWKPTLTSEIGGDL